MKPRTAARYLAIIISLYACRVSKVQADSPPLVLYGSSGPALAQSLARYRAGDPAVVPIINALLKNAQKALADGPYSVVYKRHTLPGIHIHDYISMAPYTWPNPKTADHLPYVDRDGQRNPEFKDYDALPLMNLTDHAYVLAL
ncbi:MAG TPA: alginate lyase family protein, partial [Tepidisphaeraceae bacterium]|nr:alginate lyase family protein [Tepidisphaeraceae bacterium]